MNPFEQQRRRALFGVGAMGIHHALPQGSAEAQTPPGKGYVLGVTEGEHLIHFRDRGNIYIKLGSATGSPNLAVGTQQVMTGTGIPIHRHLKMDETFYVIEGSGTFILNDVPQPFEEDSVIYIPRNSWHGFFNPDHELLLL